MNPAELIPKEDLVKMLCEAVWYTGGRDFNGREGYSFDVQEETCRRDVLYRDAKLYPTPEEALVAHWKRHFKA